jgi:hypothetical protein
MDIIAVRVNRIQKLINLFRVRLKDTTAKQKARDKYNVLVSSKVAKSGGLEKHLHPKETGLSFNIKNVIKKHTTEQQHKIELNAQFAIERNQLNPVLNQAKAEHHAGANKLAVPEQQQHFQPGHQTKMTQNDDILSLYKY